MASSPTVLVQYIVVRTSPSNLSASQLLASTAHSLVKLNREQRNGCDNNTLMYLKETNSMRKVVLGAEDNTTFEKVAAKLDSKAIPYEMFKENGEICSLIAKVCPKEKLQSIFKGLKLLK